MLCKLRDEGDVHLHHGGIGVYNIRLDNITE